MGPITTWSSLSWGLFRRATFDGCTDPEACNYDAEATLDDGVVILGRRCISTAMEMDGQFLPSTSAQSFLSTVDLDGDCNDANSTIYPGAPGNATGNDNNCNGIAEPDEEEPATCPEDVNADGVVSVADNGRVV